MFFTNIYDLIKIETIYLWCALIIIFFLAIFFVFLGNFINFILYKSFIIINIKEKLSIYECGFLPFEDALIKFDFQFFLLSLLFILFDLEIVFLYPWILVMHDVSLSSFYGLLVFLLFLAIGFVYEWLHGVLYWNV